ncbi:MAG: SAM-dependent methyltransferase [Candidatus Methanoperedens nitroreducens]|uniref:SAM-dependent methyltransferase n=1 Tax=Candidatus Methanoperedens nitratireducens TaxID=1392998 RepID=A0A0P8CN11_9EURY|nr:MAG: SAM-dependent methyltransferase [Candidatus Methanoperedens sp. BLZ1]
MKHNTEKVGQVPGLMSPILEKWRLKKIMKWVHGDTILDCGCGAGKILDYLPSTTTSYTGIDSNEQVIKDAKTRKTNYPKDFVVANIGKINFGINYKYDTIIMSAFIEHTDNPLDILKQFKKYLKKNGVIIITTPTSKAKHFLDFGSKLMIFSRDAYQEHRSHFSEDALFNLIKLADLKVIHYEKFEFGLNQLIVVGECRSNNE